MMSSSNVQEVNLYEVGDFTNVRISAKPGVSGSSSMKAKVIEVHFDPTESEKYGMRKYSYLVEYTNRTRDRELVKEDRLSDTPNTIVSQSSRLKVTMTDAEVAARQRVRKLRLHGFESPSWYSFKNPKYVAMRRRKVGKGKSWKSVPKIIAQENYEYLSSDIPTYLNIQAPPPIHPPKKYCDITGLVAKYTDPRTGIRYASSESYNIIQGLPHETVQEILQLRQAHFILK
eukprot:54927_1